MNQLRRIAVWVHETPSQTFRWVLTEGKDGRLRDLRSSEHEFMSFEGALDEGADALKQMCGDSRQGPRYGAARLRLVAEGKGRVQGAPTTQIR